MLGSRPLSRTTAFAPRRDLKPEKPFHQERPALFVASPNHNPKLPILSISYLSRFPPPVPLSASKTPHLVNIVPVPLSCPQYRTCPAFRLLSRFPPPLSRFPPPRFPPPCPAFRLLLSRFPPPVPLSASPTRTCARGRGAAMYPS
jgi:hypothetical protein